jgi:putative transposase
MPTKVLLIQLKPLLDREDSTLSPLYNKNKIVCKQFFTVEFLVLDKKTTSTIRKIISSPSTQERRSSLRLALDSILNEKVCVPFWNDYCKEIQSNLWLPSVTDFVDSDLNSLSISSLKTVENSWFSTKLQVAPKVNSYPTFFQSSTSSLVEFTGCESIKIKSKKIRIYPTQIQKSILNNWFGASRFAFNETVKFLNESGQNANWKTIKTPLLKLLPEWSSDVPYQIKSVAIRDCCKAFSMCKRKNKGITKDKWHKVSYRSRKDSKQTIYIPKSAIKEKGVYHTILGELKISEELPQKIMDSRLSLDNGNYYLIIPYEQATTLSENQTRVVALDPGIRTFQTFYNPEFSGLLGNGDIGRITRLCHHLDNLISKKSKSTSKQKQRIGKAIKRMRNKIKNLVGEMHHKISKFLVEHFDIIFLPSFDVSQMVKRGKRKLNSKTARSLLTWSHYRFKCFLKNKCEEFNKLLLIVNEAYTSKTLSWTGRINYSLGGSKIIQDDSHCVNRDINGARNIWVKSVSRILETLGDSPSGINTCALLT